MLKSDILEGKIFVYPTDTIYGIGCDATNNKSVLKIRKIKRRDKKPFSIIAPSKKWITENFELKHKDLLKKFPGPFTFVMKLKNKSAISKHVSYTDKVGVRIPDNSFTRKVQKSGKPFVTTSVNISGEPHLVNPSKLNPEIAEQIDRLIDEGKLSGKPSTVIDLTEVKPKIIRA